MCSIVYEVDDVFAAKIYGVLESTRGALIYDSCVKVIASATGQMRVCAKDVSEGSCERCGSVTDSVPKLKVTGVFKDGEGGEMRVHLFGDVAEKAVRMTVEEAADMENEAVENGDADRSQLRDELASRGVFCRQLLICVDVKVFNGSKGRRCALTAFDVAEVGNGEVPTGPSSSERRPVMETPSPKIARVGAVLTPTPPSRG